MFYCNVPLQVGRIRRTVSIAAANHRNVVGHKTHSNCWALGAAPGTTPGIPTVGLGAFYGQGLGSETLHTTSCSSGQRDVPKSLAFAALILCQTFRAATLPLNSSVMLFLNDCLVLQRVKGWIAFREDVFAVWSYLK